MLITAGLPWLRPAAAGVAALVLTANSSLTANVEVRSILQTDGRKSGAETGASGIRTGQSRSSSPSSLWKHSTRSGS